MFSLFSQHNLSNISHRFCCYFFCILMGFLSSDSHHVLNLPLCVHVAECHDSVKPPWKYWARVDVWRDRWKRRQTELSTDSSLYNPTFWFCNFLVFLMLIYVILSWLLYSQFLLAYFEILGFTVSQFVGMSFWSVFYHDLWEFYSAPSYFSCNFGWHLATIIFYCFILKMK